MKKKAMALVLALGLVVVGIVGGTMAWLTAEAKEVKNTFTDSDINIVLDESKHNDDGTLDTQTRVYSNSNYKMIPGHTIAKDPKVTVESGSEDCWLFVKITESTTPDLDAYICYAIADQYNEATNPNGWQIVQSENDEGEIVIGREVIMDAAPKEFAILGAGEYVVSETEKYAWSANALLTKPEATKDMMDAIDGDNETKPTLTFEAAAVQLYKNQDTKFSVSEAYGKVTWPSDNP